MSTKDLKRSDTSTVKLNTPPLPSIDKATLLHSSVTNNQALNVYEDEHFIWFTLGGDITQSVLLKNTKSQLILHVPQAMLISLLWTKPNKVLNLGLGGGSFERKLSHLGISAITSVEQSAEIIQMAKSLFYLPTHIRIEHLDAMTFLANTQQTFDLILCDLFECQRNPEALSERGFYKQLKACANKNTVIAINLEVTSESQLINILSATRCDFSYAAIIDFTDFKNIVLLLSQSDIPDQDWLLQRNNEKSCETQIDFAVHISQLKRLQK